jgi:hypothetical protein
VRLHNEHVTASDAFTEAWTQLTVGKFDDIGFTELDFEMAGNFLGKIGVRTARVEGHSLRGDLVDRFVHVSRRPLCLGQA